MNNNKYKKALIFDSSSIITLAMNGLVSILPKLKESFQGSFFITPYVRKEVVDNPLGIHKFELEALNILSLIESGTLEIINPKGLESETQKIKAFANTMFIAKGEKMKIMHDAECSCMALASLLTDYKSLLVIDERTARMLIENPENLRRLFENKLHTPVMTAKTPNFKNLNVIRSSELALIALRKGIISFPASKSDVIEALLYASKHNGCSISFDEIQEAKRLF